jgi:hypothetical protein
MEGLLSILYSPLVQYFGQAALLVGVFAVIWSVVKYIITRDATSTLGVTLYFVRVVALSTVVVLTTARNIVKNLFVPGHEAQLAGNVIGAFFLLFLLVRRWKKAAPDKPVT